jgi:hypothetical protein
MQEKFKYDDSVLANLSLKIPDLLHALFPKFGRYIFPFFYSRKILIHNIFCTHSGNQNIFIICSIKNAKLPFFRQR